MSSAKWGQVDIWINNAGQNVPHKFSWETGEEYTSNVVGTNIVGMIYGSQVAAAEMIKRGHGVFIVWRGLVPIT